MWHNIGQTADTVIDKKILSLFIEGGMSLHRHMLPPTACVILLSQADWASFYELMRMTTLFPSPDPLWSLDVKFFLSCWAPCWKHVIVQANVATNSGYNTPYQAHCNAIEQVMQMITLASSQDHVLSRDSFKAIEHCWENNQVQLEKLRHSH